MIILSSSYCPCSRFYYVFSVFPIVMTGPTNLMHFIGLPSLAIRLGMGDDGMPKGMILYGTDEQRLFSAALTLEKYCEPVAMPHLSA